MYVFDKDGLPINLQAQSAIAVTAGATVFPASSLFIGTGGDVTVTTAKGETGVVFKNLPNAYILPVLVTSVTAASATDILRIN